MDLILQRLNAPGNEILIVALLILLGLIFSRLAKKIHLPQITGYIVAGIIIGNPVLHLISKENFHSLHNINLIALGLMSITIGAHLNFYKLKNSGRRVLSVLIGESLVSFVFVYIALHFFVGKDNMLSLLIASISIATAPAATVAIIKESRSKGLVVNTLMPVVAINNVLCIIVFGVMADFIGIGDTSKISVLAIVTVFIRDFGISLVVGIITFEIPVVTNTVKKTIVNT